MNEKEHPLVVKLRCRISNNTNLLYDGMTGDLIKIQLRDGTTQYSLRNIRTLSRRLSL